ncbi:hypothetical protein CEXT_770711 [Caerostris extrusa]|uniref:Uncharacterized protein n=1 Tax=Caerostris extrusa TaxID=172846 RepID=A0AAV4QH62_CAEEX|nr:hypothetical protein CEXT_770711 [Caerostris extrusa]
MSQVSEQHSTHHNLEEEKTRSTHSLAQSEMIQHECNMFPSSLVQKVVTHHLNITGGHFIYFHHLCEAILDYKDDSAKSNCEVLSSENSGSSTNIKKYVLKRGDYACLECLKSDGHIEELHDVTEEEYGLILRIMEIGKKSQSINLFDFKVDAIYLILMKLRFRKSDGHIEELHDVTEEEYGLILRIMEIGEKVTNYKFI